MTSLTSIAWSSSCYQLRFSFESRKSSPQLLVRNRMLRSDHRWRGLIRICGFNGAERVRLVGDSWSRLAASSNGLSDWAAGDGEVVPDEESQKNGVGGIMGAALAGVFLVTGLTFAALAIRRRGTSSIMQEMRPLSQQQAVLLSSGEEFNQGEEDEKEGKFIVQDKILLQDDHVLERKAGIKENSSMLSEFPKGVTRSTVSDNDVRLTLVTIENPESMSSHHTTSVEEDLSFDSTFEGQDSNEISPHSQQLPILKAADGLAYASGFTGSDNVANTTPEIHLSVAEPNNKTSAASDVKTSDSTALEKFSESDISPAIEELSSSSVSPVPAETETLNHSGVNNLDVVSPMHQSDEGTINPSSAKGDFDIRKTISVSDGKNDSQEGLGSSQDLSEEGGSHADKQGENGVKDAEITRSPSTIGSQKYNGIPAPSALSASLLFNPGKVLVPAVVDQVHGQALAALQVLKVIEPDAQPSHLCTRREYARWLLSASGSLSRNSICKVYPAMYIENVTELAFDDIAPEDPDFASIQGLAEAGLISSKLSRRDMSFSSEEDMGPLYFFPDSPLSRQDLVTWKLALEKKQLPESDKKILRQASGFIDIDRIDPDAWPALVADISAGENGIIALAFGYTRLFQPDKPVTKAQAAIALSTGEAADVVSEELARIEAESIADNAVAAHSALVAEVEKDINANFEKDLLVEREKIEALEKMAKEAKREVERLRGERERDNVALMKERAAIDSEMEMLSRMKREVEEQLESLMTKKVEISCEKDRINKLKNDTEEENQAIARLQHDLEVERKALAMARAWAEDEAKRVMEHAKALEEARERWERHGIKVVVEDDLREEASAGVTWLQMEREHKLNATVERAETLVDKLKVMAAEVRGRSKEVIHSITERVLVFISIAKEWIADVGRKSIELKEVTLSRVSESMQEIQQHTAGFRLAVKEGANRFIEECREGVGKLSQKFKTA